VISSTLEEIRGGWGRRERGGDNGEKVNREHFFKTSLGELEGVKCVTAFESFGC
jgi:hypothetical protein